MNLAIAKPLIPILKPTQSFIQIIGDAIIQQTSTYILTDTTVMQGVM